MKYNLFLFDLDDTLLDFKESERLSFRKTLDQLGVKENIHQIYQDYQAINHQLWKDFEDGKTTKDHLKVERFRKTFEAHRIDLDPDKASNCYLETLPETVVLIDHAKEICEWLATLGEIGIITNGIDHVQRKRIENSGLAPYLSFVGVSDACGYAKPDSRFFEYTVRLAKSFKKESTVIVGDRIETDIKGAKNFGISGCWFNPDKAEADQNLKPTYEIHHLSELTGVLRK